MSPSTDRLITYKPQFHCAEMKDELLYTGNVSIAQPQQDKALFPSSSA